MYIVKSFKKIFSLLSGWTKVYVFLCAYTISLCLVHRNGQWNRFQIWKFRFVMISDTKTILYKTNRWDLYIITCKKSMYKTRKILHDTKVTERYGRYQTIVRKKFTSLWLKCEIWGLQRVFTKANERYKITLNNRTAPKTVINIRKAP